MRIDQFCILSKQSVAELADVLAADLTPMSLKGAPLPVELIVCIALNHYSGGHFQRISGICSGLSQFTARQVYWMKMTFFVMISCYQAIVDVTNALVRKRNQFIFMPNAAEMEKTAANMLERFKLPRFALAVDGMVARFQEAPRRLPEGKHAQLFWCRKQCYAINCQVVANDWLICDLDLG